MTPDEKIELDDPRWLMPLFNQALAATETLRPRLRPSEIGRDAQDLLWSSGVLLGAGKSTSTLDLHSDAEAAFVQLVTLELQRAAALLRPAHAGEPSRLRWTLGALLAASYEEYGVANVFEEASRGEPLSPTEEERLFEVIAAQIRRHAYLQGNPAEGIPLHAGLAALEVRAFIRFVAAHRTGHAIRKRAAAYRQRTSRLKALLVELVWGMFAATAPEGDADRSRIAARQVRAIFMLPPDRRTALASLRKPRDPAIVLQGVPAATRLLLVEQTVLAALLASRWSPDARAWLEPLAIPSAQLASMEARSAAFLVEHQASALALARSGHHTPLDTMLRHANDAVQEAAEAVGEQIRETGELGAYLTRMARGETLTPEERHQMRAQLIDVAKVVPSLAIFAAPGGMLLLPLALKFLPFDLRPSAFQNRSSSPPPARRPKSPAP